MTEIRPLRAQIDDAIMAHVNWLVLFKTRFTGISRDSVEPDSMRDDTACQFGKWLHGGSGPLPDPELCQRIKALHRDFHVAAAEVAESLRQYRDRTEIEVQLKGLDSLSRDLITALRQARG